MQKISIDSKKAPLPVGPYPHAKWVGPFLFLSGIGPRKRGEAEIPGVQLDQKNGNVLNYDIEIETRSVFTNIQFVLEEAGLGLDDLVDVTVFLTNMKDDFKIFNNLYKEYFPKESLRPCRTTVEISSLPTPIHIELKCMAYSRNKS